MSPLILAFTSLLSLPAVSSASLSRQISLGDFEYWLPPKAAWTLDSWNTSSAPGKDEFVPLTVVNVNGTADAEVVTSALERYNSTDDVWTPYFAQVLSIQGPSDDEGKGDGLVKDLSSDYNVTTVLVTKRQSKSAAPAGPYFIQRSTGDVYQAYKLYADTNQAFLQSSYQDPSGMHHTLSGAAPSAAGLSIGVPSRLYFTPSKDQPLAGVRIAVKDLYDLKGMKTSSGNRALFEMSDVKNKTAYAVQKLIDAGAVIIGKNKLSEFAYAGPYVTEHIDYLLPFNPRGDGYNSPGDSSGGSGASVASYDWLDASMGSDTGGSIRGPAANNGVHGNRPTHGAVNLTGALPLAPSMDTSGMLARDPVIWSKVNKVLYADTTDEYDAFPSVLYIDPSSAQMLNESQEQFPELYEAMTSFINALTDILSANVSVFSVDEAWNQSAPAGGLNQTAIAAVVNSVYGNLTAYEQWDEFGRDFFETYMEAHNGSLPHMAPGTREGWIAANDTMTEASHKQDLEIKKSVAQWVTEEFLVPDNETCSDAIYIYFLPPQASFSYKPDVSEDSANPYITDLQKQLSQQQQTLLQLNATLNCNSTLGSPESCDEALEALEEASQQPAQPVSPGRLASVAGLPDYAMTLGSLDAGDDTFSNSTMQGQYLPLAVDIVAAPGCDFMILGIVEMLHEKGAVKKVKTGMRP